MHSETTYRPMSGWPALAGILGMFSGGFALFVYGINIGSEFPIMGAITTAMVAFICLFGFMAIAPNQSRVLLLFGSYKGSVKESGFYWVIP
ncbi:MAG: SPFH domain-containing protein, partial [Planctomycetaceae bacterium]